MRQHKTGEHVERKQGDLISSDRHQPADRAGRQAHTPRRALERARQQPERQGQVGQTDDLTGVLNARAGRTAERECHRGHERAARVPAAIAEQQDDPARTEEQIGEGHAVEGAQADRGIEGGQQDVERREQERLWIGNLRPAGKDVR